MKRNNNNFAEADDKAAVETGLTMVGIFALADPLRPGVAEAIDTCHRAGVNVRMCTGDNLDTATAISLQAHIITPADIADIENRSLVCMTGKDFRD
jgi:Ca2+-transporting ATPase